jgi:hypothetical protein
MIWVLYIGGGLLALFVALFAVLLIWGFWHMGQSRRKALEVIRGIELADIDSLARECVDVFERKLGVRLDVEDCDATAQKLDDAFRDPTKLKEAFARDDFYWYFAKPVGALLGELLRRHAKHEWRKKDGEAPFMELKLNDGYSEVHPFEKVIKHVQGGEPGDLIAYVEFARTIEQPVELD